jgi:hypothetical protein
VIFLSRAWWVALVLGSLWLPVVVVNVVIDPPADLVTKRDSK